MTLKDLDALDCEVLTPAVAAQVLGVNPHSIRVAAHQAPDALGFPVIVCGRRVLIPRVAFIDFMRGQKQ